MAFNTTCWGAGPAIAAGSHGCCIPVKDALTGERFCLKVPRGDAGEPVPRSHLQKEFELLKRLNHVNVVRALSWVNSREGDVQGFVMPLGKVDLWQWVKCWSQDDVLLTRHSGVSILVQLARGMSYVHHAGIVHLDLKPENVILQGADDSMPLVCVADFGQSMRGPTRDGSAGDRIAADMVNTKVYRPLHLFYAARSEVNVRYTFDLWVLGCIVFDVLQNHPRWRSSDGRLLRLFEQVDMKTDYSCAVRVRNLRLVRMLDKEVVMLVVRLQPDHPVSRGSDRLLSADLAVAILQLLEC